MPQYKTPKNCKHLLVHLTLESLPTRVFCRHSHLHNTASPCRIWPFPRRYFWHNTFSYFTGRVIWSPMNLSLSLSRYSATRIILCWKRSGYLAGFTESLYMIPRFSSSCPRELRTNKELWNNIIMTTPTLFFSPHDKKVWFQIVRNRGSVPFETSPLANYNLLTRV